MTRKPVRRVATASNRRSVVRIAYLIGRVDSALRRAIWEAVSPLNLTLQQFTALSVLSGHDHLSNAELAERTFMTPQSANEVTKVLVRKALIMRRAHPSHGRIIQLRLTAKGEALRGRADAAVLKVEQRTLATLTAARRRGFREHLKACLRALDEHAVVVVHH
jgi:DNA-binding MarR family transcriptional regulator